MLTVLKPSQRVVIPTCGENLHRISHWQEEARHSTKDYPPLLLQQFALCIMWLPDTHGCKRVANADM